MHRILRNQLWPLGAIGILLCACGNSGSNRYGSEPSSAAAKTDGKTQMLSDQNINPTNLLSAVQNFTTSDGDQFEVLGKFVDSELPSFQFDSNAPFKEIGTLSYVREHLDYLNSYRSGPVDPVLSREVKNANVKIFLIQSNQADGFKYIGVKAGVHLDFGATTSPIEVATNYQQPCIEFLVPGHEPAVESMFSSYVNTETVICTPAGECNMHKNNGAFLNPVSREELVSTYHASCTKNVDWPMTKLQLANTSKVTGFKIELSDEYRTLAKEINFTNPI